MPKDAEGGGPNTGNTLLKRMKTMAIIKRPGSTDAGASNNVLAKAKTMERVRVGSAQNDHDMAPELLEKPSMFKKPKFIAFKFKRGVRDSVVRDSFFDEFGTEKDAETDKTTKSPSTEDINMTPKAKKPAPPSKSPALISKPKKRNKKSSSPQKKQKQAETDDEVEVSDLWKHFEIISASRRKSEYDHLRWKPHNALAPHPCGSCGVTMQGSMAKGLRHHCRKCGEVVCTKCIKKHKQKIKLFIDRDDNVKEWKEPTGRIDPPAQAICEKCYDLSMKSVRKLQRDAKRNPHVFCSMCYMPCPQKAVADEVRLDTLLLLKPEDEMGKVIAQSTVANNNNFICRYCRYARPDRRGGLKLYSVFVSDLPPFAVVEDIHSAFEDRFGFVHEVFIPTDEDGANETDGVDFKTHAIVQFYNPGQYFPKSHETPTGIAEGFEGAIGVGLCRVPLPGAPHDREEVEVCIHRLKWAPGQYQTVVPCFIRESETLNYAESQTIYADQRHLSEERRTKEWETRLEIDLRRQKCMRVTYERKIHTNRFPQLGVAHEVSLSSGATLESMALSAVKLGDLHALKAVCKSNWLSAELSEHGEPTFHIYKEKFANGQTLLHVAVSQGHLSIVAFLLSEQIVGKVVEFMEYSDQVSKNRAKSARQHSRKVVEEKSSSEDEHEEDENSHVHSIQASVYALNEALNAKDNMGNTPMHMCALSGNVDMFRLLLAKGGEATVIGFHGKTCLHYAAANGQSDMCKLLITECFPYSLFGKLDVDGKTALATAIAYKNKETVEVITREIDQVTQMVIK